MKELKNGDCIEIVMAKYPLPSNIYYLKQYYFKLLIFFLIAVCDPKESNEWFSALGRCLHWNIRERQKPIPDSAKKAFL